MTKTEAWRQAETPFEEIMRRAILQPKQRQWLIQVYGKLSEFGSTLIGWTDNTATGRRQYFDIWRQAQKLVEHADTAYNRVAQDEHKVDSYQECDGEAGHACFEAMRRLRVVALMHVV